MIVVAGELVDDVAHGLAKHDLLFKCWDDGDVYNGLQQSHKSVPGSLHVVNHEVAVDVRAVGKPADRVRVVVYRKRPSTDGVTDCFPYEVRGYVRRGGRWRERPVQVVPVKQELFSRVGGLLETDVLAGKTVFQTGAGSGGAPILVELAKCGIGRFLIADHDRLEIGNGARHLAGLSHVGRYKTKFMAEAIREKNPYAEVRTWERKIGWKDEEFVRECVRTSDVAIGAADDQESRRVLNKVCVEEDKPLIIAGAFRRAYGGQVLRIHPGISPCYECVLHSWPEKACDQEVSNQAQAQRLAYADRPVAIEPGLSADIAPISLMVVKLALQELLEDQDTSLRSLDEDLVAPWFLWLNRREAETEYEQLKPLEFGIDDMRVLRWYGIAIAPRPDCPCCGDFVGHAAEQEGVEVTAADAASFGTD